MRYTVISYLASITWFAVASFSCAHGQQPLATSAQFLKPLTINALWTLDTTYTDRRHGVSFRYPSAWSSGSSFGYHPPALTTAHDPEPIAGFGFGTEGAKPEHREAPYASTTLEGFGIVYSAAATQNAGACEALATRIAGISKHHAYTLAGRLFSARETFTAGMNQSAGGTLYSIYARSTCYLFETDEASRTSGLLEGEKELTLAQKKQIESGWVRIMQSIRINGQAATPTRITSR